MVFSEERYGSKAAVYRLDERACPLTGLSKKLFAKRALISRCLKFFSDLVLFLRRKRIPIPEVPFDSLPFLRGKLLPLPVSFSDKLLILRRELLPSIHPTVHLTALFGREGFPPFHLSLTIRPPADDRRAFIVRPVCATLMNESMLGMRSPVRVAP